MITGGTQQQRINATLRLLTGFLRFAGIAWVAACLVDVIFLPLSNQDDASYHKSG